jgi:hypothetical protein
VLGLGARWLVVLLAVAMALEQLGIGGTVLVVSFSVLFGGIVLALALAVGLGARATVARSLGRAFPATPEVPKPPGSDDQVDQADDYPHM